MNTIPHMILNYTKLFSFCGLVLLCLGLSQCKPSKEICAEELPPPIEYNHETLINFVENRALGQILDLAKENKKMAFVEFSTEWCLPCQLMHENVYTNKVIANYYNQHFVSCMIDAEKGEGPDMAYLFQVKEFPTLLFLDEKGRVIDKHTGGIGASKFMLFAEEAQKKYEAQLAANAQ